VSRNFCDYAIPKGWKPGGLALVGRDPGADEVRRGVPFIGRAGRVLDDHLRQAGVRRERCAILNVSRYQPRGNEFGAHPRSQLEAEVDHLRRTLRQLKPSVIVALGNEASWVLIDGWPGQTIFQASGIQQRRGYVWDSLWASVGVLSTVHPAAVDREWVPWSPLLAMDLRKAKELHEAGALYRPERKVVVASSKRDAEILAARLAKVRTLACDIENYDERTIACVGFAASNGEAVVFPAERLEQARGLLEDPTKRLIFQNGMYDVYFLLTRCGIEVRGQLEDTLLQWHVLAPELAGAAEGPKADKRRRTAKSLAFLASLHTLDPWWKDYDFADDSERFELNGKDCCLTREIWELQQEHVEAAGLEQVYRNECGLIWPLVRMQQRGMRVNDAERTSRLDEVGRRLEARSADIAETTKGLLDRLAGGDDVVPNLLQLFQRIDGVCPCCRHGKAKQRACWECAGFDKKPGKRELSASGRVLETCAVCGGEPRREWLEYNPNSGPQTQALLYDVLRLPTRYESGRPTVNEKALKDLLGMLPEEEEK
jgi:uracil-DNA glycosylase